MTKEQLDELSELCRAIGALTNDVMPFMKRPPVIVDAALSSLDACSKRMRELLEARQRQAGER